MDKWPFLNRADAIMAKRDIGQKVARRFWGFYAEAGRDRKNTLWSMNDMMRKLENPKVNSPNGWLSSCVYDRLVEVVTDFKEFKRPVPLWFMDDVQWRAEQRRIRLARRDRHW